jgi:beta-mannanase
VSSDELYKGIMAGKYDTNVVAIASKTATLKSPVTVRWAQEMDHDNGQFSWQRWAPEQYVNAYRHVISLYRKHDENAHYMWSPLGQEGVGAHAPEAYYPGDEYVDAVGLTIFGLQKLDRNLYGHDRTFREMLAVPYPRVARFNKPIFVAELGYDGDDAYVRDWLQSVAQPRDDFPLLKGVIYYDNREVYPWLHGYGLPNWRVTVDKPGAR